MDGIAKHIRWTTIVAVLVVLTAIFMVINAIDDDPLITSTDAISTVTRVAATCNTSRRCRVRRLTMRCDLRAGRSSPRHGWT